MRNYATKRFGASFSVTVVPTLKDNFSYLITDHTTGALAAVDVNSDIQPILKYVAENNLLKGSGGGGNHASQDAVASSPFRTILTTHKHWDHSGGNTALVAALAELTRSPASSIAVVGGAKDAVPGATKLVKEGDVVAIGQLRVDVIDAPCHTSGHVLYKVQHPSHPADGVALFTGDTMFIAGVGAFFEGDAADMCRAMRKVYCLNDPDGGTRDATTFIFPGHEYTAGFMNFSAKVMATKSIADAAFIDTQAAKYAAAVHRGDPSVPSSLADEKRQNLFLRVADPAFCAMMDKGDAVRLMDYLYNACD